LAFGAEEGIMTLPPTVAAHQRARARSEAFGYTCRRCSLCCYDKVIHVTPYEAARLSRLLGISTTEFREKWTENGSGTSLARRGSGACVFLNQGGCSVHSDRPLVCRIYPLGRVLDADGTEHWTHIPPHPETQGIYSTDGAIADFIASQGALPFMEATEEYALWLDRAVAVLKTGARSPEGTPDPNDLLDIDRVIADHCRATGEEEPVDIEGRKKLHLRLLHEILDDVEGEKLS
jgi:Fe-S-cluster containining protein